MTNALPQLAGLEVKNLFPTPLIITRFADATGINAMLKQVIEDRCAADGRGVAKSNIGGWQSTPNFLDWAGEAGKHLIDSAKDLANQLTVYQDVGGYNDANIDWKVNAWANINGRGNSNNVHSHPGAYWSGTYYVHIDRDPAKDDPKSMNGQFEMLDPRGVIPIMYAPHLAMKVKGCLTAGLAEFHTPQPGDMILFPSWLLHAVMPYTGDGKRISVAFNFSL